MTRTEELMNMTGAKLIELADKYSLKVYANKERTQLKESKSTVIAKIVAYEARIAEEAKKMAKAEKVASESKKEPKKESKKEKKLLTEEEKKAKRAERYQAKKAKRAEIMEGRDPKTEEFEFNGKAQTLTEWSKELDITRKTLYRRIYYMGWTVEEAFTGKRVK